MKQKLKRIGLSFPSKPTKSNTRRSLKKMARKHKQKSKASFPPEIIREILLKASVKSLLRCKSVCKEWYSLISDQHFIKSQHTLSCTNNINFAHHRLIYNTSERNNDLNSCPLYDVLFDKSVNNALLLENPFQQTRPHRPVRIVGSCNGLLCILAEDDNTLFIYNPSTRATNILPSSEQGLGWGSELYGFGYDETTHDYKVVKLYLTGDDWSTMIYSLKAGSWKETVRFPLDTALNDAKFFNGALHWLIGDECTLDVVSLDLGKETYGKVLQPKYYDKGYKTLTLGVLGEWLCVLCNYHESHVVDVWVMKVYGEQDSWTKLACILCPTNPRSIYLDPLYISKDGKVLLQVGSQLLVCDSKDSSSPEIVNFDDIDEACVVVESLVSPFPPLALADNNEN